MARKKKFEHRGLADWISAFHCLPHPLSYDEYFGLQLHVERVSMQRSIEHKRAIEAARGTHALGREWFDAETVDEALIRERMADENNDRMEARVMAQFRR